MDMSISDGVLTPVIAAHDRAAVDRRLDRLEAELLGVAPQTAWREFEGVHHDIARCVAALKAPLLDLGVAWSGADKDQAAWIYAIHRRFAALGLRISELLASKLGADNPRCLGSLANALFHAGEAVKSEIGVACPEPRAYAALHTLMRMAIESGQLRRDIEVQAGGRHVTCTLESLYFRALLLSRFTSGSLTCRQVEILDAWLLMWSPALRGTTKLPEGASLRVDLDSEAGFSRDGEAGGAGALYLPQEPIAAAYAAILAKLQCGEIVPADGVTARLRVEEHIAVLDLVRRGLRQSLEGVVRAERTDADATVELFVGLAETTEHGFSTHAAIGGSFELASDKRTAPAVVGKRERDDPLGAIFDIRRRMARLVNTSATGVCLEGSSADCADISAGDLVGVRTSSCEPLLLGKVVRCVASSTPGNTVIGIRKLSSAGRHVVARDPSATIGAAMLPLIFVPGEDATGRHDGYLVSEREFEKRAPLEITLAASTFAFRFNRVRERGRGWVLAGFEIGGVRGSPPASTACAGPR